MRVELPQVAVMTPEERAEAQQRIAASQQQLLNYLAAAHRQWLVLNAQHLVKALPFPTGVETFQQIIACYRDYRAEQRTGRKVEVEDPQTKRKYAVDERYGEQLDLTEIDQAIVHLARVAREIDQDWTPPQI